MKALIKAKGGGIHEEEEMDEWTKEYLLLEDQIKNSKKKKAILKSEFQEVGKRLEKALDPEVVEKANL